MPIRMTRTMLNRKAPDGMNVGARVQYKIGEKWTGIVVYLSTDQHYCKVKWDRVKGWPMYSEGNASSSLYRVI